MENLGILLQNRRSCSRINASLAQVTGLDKTILLVYNRTTHFGGHYGRCFGYKERKEDRILSLKG